MKAAIVAIVLSCTAMSATAKAQPNHGPYINKHAPSLMRICTAIAANKPARLRQAVKAARVSFRDIQHGLTCNDMDPITFAYHANAESTAALIARYNRAQHRQLLAKNR